MTKLPFTSVVSLHTNPMTCGVAKFSAELAKRLGVPFCGVGDEPSAFPLLSLKASELPAVFRIVVGSDYGVFWHDAGLDFITRKAAHVFYADPSLGSPGLWCPSLIETRKPLRLFSFGMGHKLQVEKFRELRAALGDRPFQLRVSVGLHEGMTLDDATKNIEPLKAIMGPEHVRFLGCLSDESVVEELHQADYAVAFFEHGARMNNTTIHAATDAGVKVITNISKHWLWHPLMTTVYQAFPPSQFSWGRLISAMEKVCASSPSTVAR